MLNKTIRQQYKKNQTEQKETKDFSKRRLNTSNYIYGNSQKIKHRVYNSRVKTQTLQQVSIDQKLYALNKITNAISQGNNLQKIFHPDIYHRPQIRKKYFCQVVDTYMSFQKNPEKKNSKLNTLVLNSLKQKQYSFINDLKIQLTQNKNNQESSTALPKTQKKKRALTASYTRRQQTNQVKQIPQQQKIINTNNNNTQILLQNDKNHTSKQINISIFLKNKVNKKLSILNNYLKSTHIEHQKISSFSPTRKPSRKCNPEVDINYSLSSQSQTQTVQGQLMDKNNNERLKTEKVVRTQLLHKKTDVKKQKMKYKYKRSSPNTKSSSNSRSGSFSNSKSQSLFNLFNFNKNNKNTKQLLIQQEQKIKLERQLNFRLKLVKPQYGLMNWSVKFIYKHDLYTIYYVSGSQLMKSKMVNNLASKSTNKTLKLQQLSKSKFNIKIKRFSQNIQGQKIRNTFEKVKSYETSYMWALLPKNKIIEDTQQQVLYYSHHVKPLRQQLFNFVKQQKSQKQNQGSPLYKIHLTQSYYQLFHNNCQYFIDIINAVAKDLIKMKGKVINNKISLDNVYRLQQKAIKIGDWGCSALCQKIKVNNSQIQFKDQPLIKIQQTYNSETKDHWLLSPENLPPEIIQLIMRDEYCQIWQLENTPQVWCLGLMIFQLLTCIPVWMPYNTIVEHKIPKCGYIYDQYKRLSQIYTLQCKMPTIVSRWIRDQKNSALYKSIHPQIIILMKSMLQINIRLRPNPQQIIKRLNLHH